MAAVLSTIHPDEVIETTAGVRSLVSSIAERHQTGLVRLAYPNEELFYIFFKRGKVLASTLVKPGQDRVFKRGAWEQQINDAGDAYPVSIPLSPLGLFLFGLSLQAGEGEGAETLSSSDEISKYIKAKSANPAPCLIQLRWKHAVGLVFFPSQKSTPHSVFISHQRVLDEEGISPLLYQWKDAQCEAATIIPASSADLWQEYELRRLFAEITNSLLTRFETLSGRALMESLIRVMAAFATERDLELSIRSRHMEDGEVFLSPKVAAENYRFFLNEMFEHCAVVIGPRLLASQLREIILSMTESDQGLIKEFRLLPKGYFYD